MIAFILLFAAVGFTVLTVAAWWCDRPRRPQPPVNDEYPIRHVRREAK